MKASELSFESMIRIASGHKELANATSFLQVEYGIAELHACWDGFVDTSDHYNQFFKNRKAIADEFCHALTEYINYICVAAPI